MTLKKDPKFDEKGTKICTLMGYFCKKFVWAKEYRGDAFWKMTYGFKIDIIQLVNFHTSSLK